MPGLVYPSPCRPFTTIVSTVRCCLQDFDSDKLKHKQHWNSFTTAFFIPMDKVLLDLETKGCLRIDALQAKALLNLPLRCHRCQAEQQSMAALKSHITVAACK
jgi:aprataxin